MFEKSDHIEKLTNKLQNLNNEKNCENNFLKQKISDLTLSLNNKLELLHDNNLNNEERIHKHYKNIMDKDRKKEIEMLSQKITRYEAERETLMYKISRMSEPIHNDDLYEKYADEVNETNKLQKEIQVLHKEIDELNFKIFVCNNKQV